MDNQGTNVGTEVSLNENERSQSPMVQRNQSSLSHRRSPSASDSIGSVGEYKQFLDIKMRGWMGPYFIYHPEQCRTMKCYGRIE